MTSINAAKEDVKTEKPKRRKKGILRKTYDAMLSIATKPYALIALFWVSFIESSFFPIPPDIMIIPMVLATPKKWAKIALVCTVGSVLGAYLGYAIGYFAFDSIAKPFLEASKMMPKFETFKEYYNQYGAWIVAGGGFTPFPYKIITIASGATGLNIFVFTIASILSRGARFFLVAFLLYKFGARIRVFIEKNLGLLTILFFLLLFGIFYLLKG